MNARPRSLVALVVLVVPVALAGACFAPGDGPPRGSTDESGPTLVPVEALPSARSHARPVAGSRAAAVPTIPFAPPDHPSPSDPVAVATMQLGAWAKDVDSMDAPSRDALQEAASELTRECPYRHTGVMAGHVIGDVVRTQLDLGPGVGPFAADGGMWQRLEELGAGTAAHEAVLDALGLASLPALDQGYLAGTAVADSLGAIEALDVRAVPAIRRAMGSVRGLVETMDGETMTRLNAAEAVVVERVEQFPLKGEMVTWRAELRAMESHARAWLRACEDASCPAPARQRAARFAEDADAVAAMLDDYIALYC